MKTSFYIVLSVAAFCALKPVSLNAQNTMVNAEVSQDNDLNGTARYVSMGGAFSALGAEITAMGDNPAAIALMRKSEVSLTAGALWGADANATKDPATEGYSRTHATFDQAGIVGAFKIDGRYMKNFNIGFNYRKKINFNNLNTALIATDGSQLNQYAEILNNYGADISTESIYGDYYNAGLLDKTTSGGDVTWRRSSQLPKTEAYGMYRMTSGAMHSYDINFSANISDRYYVGLTVGIDALNYTRESSYTETIGTDDSPLDYYIEDTHHIKGTGVNFKLGTIIRPIPDNPLRIGIAIETPTWYLLTSTYDYTLYSKFINSDEDAARYGQSKETFVARPRVYPTVISNYCDLDYSLRTPWRFRLAIGSTVDKYLAWGVDYEYATYKYEGMGYPENDSRRSIFNTIEDRDMNANTRSTLCGQHRVKLGLEYKPLSKLAIRAGYNYLCSIYKNEAWDPQVAAESTERNIGTSWITTSPTHIVTFGLGTRIKWFGVDLAYKCRFLDGCYYGNLDSYVNDDGKNIPMNLRRHSVVCTLSARF